VNFGLSPLILGLASNTAYCATTYMHDSLISFFVDRKCNAGICILKRGCCVLRC